MVKKKLLKTVAVYLLLLVLGIPIYYGIDYVFRQEPWALILTLIYELTVFLIIFLIYRRTRQYKSQYL